MTTNADTPAQPPQKRHEDALWALELAIQRKADLPLLARLASELAVVSQSAVKVDVPRILSLWNDLAPRFSYMRDQHRWNKPANDVELSLNLWEALKLTCHPARDGRPETHTVGFEWSMDQYKKAVATVIAAAVKAEKATPAVSAALAAASAAPPPPEAAPTLDAYLRATGRAGLTIQHVADAAELLAADAQRTGKTCVVMFARVGLSCDPGETAAHALMRWSIGKEERRDAAREAEHEKELAGLRAELAQARAELAQARAELTALTAGGSEAADVQPVRALALAALDDVDALERAAKAVRQRLGDLVLLRPV